MAVPDTTNFTFQDVTTEIYNDVAAGRNLSAAFTAATGTFDSRYVENKDRLSNFRNYAHSVSCSSLAEIHTVSMYASSSTTAQVEINLYSHGGTGCTVTEMGICYGVSANPTISGTHTTATVALGANSFSVSGLTSGTTYHYRAYATNGFGTTYGEDYTYVQSVVVFQGITVEGQTNSTLTIWSSITSGSNTERGICYNTSPIPTISNSKVSNGSGTGEFTTVLTGLSMDITYYMRAYAINNGTAYYSAEINYGIWS